MTSEQVASFERPFRVGINYWPARTAMGWWPAFQRGEVEADFARIAESGFDSLRLFLTWEHFQPRPDRVAKALLDQVVIALDLASQAGLSVMLTLFTGHMSGVNWAPSWALGGALGESRFRVVSENRVVRAGLRNWYTDTPLARAQAFLAFQLGRALSGHSALWAWDLGNESSNCVRPPSRAKARDWLRRISDALREGDGRGLVTIGLHMEDLEEDRKLGPLEAAEVCDFLTMHGYPGYAAWARGPTDHQLLPFLAGVTRWLGGGVDVLFSEFGVPTYQEGAPSEPVRSASMAVRIEEQAAAAYVARSLASLHDCGSMGAMLWCFADYSPAIWGAPPLDLVTHERFFGQWRADGSPKPAVREVRAFAERRAMVAPADDLSWIDMNPEEFYGTDRSSLVHLYRLYCDAAIQRPKG